MRLRVLWDPAALFVFYKLPVAAATAVDRAVIRFVERGEGQLTWVAPYHRLEAGAYDAVLVINLDAGTVVVLRILRARLR